MTKNLITYSYKIDVLCVFATLFQLENPLSVPFLDGFGGSRVQLAAKINMNILVYVNQIVLTIYWLKIGFSILFYSRRHRGTDGGLQSPHAAHVIVMLLRSGISRPKFADSFVEN